MKTLRTLALTLLATLPLTGFTAVPKDLPYPKGTPSGDEIAQQVYYVNHYFAFSDASMKSHPKANVYVLSRSPGGVLRTELVERHINNSTDGDIQSKEIVIFHKGNKDGLAMLVTEYTDDRRAPSFQIWDPRLRKVRRMPPPQLHDDWMGTVMTVADMGGRRPWQEEHRVLGTETFGQCLNTMDLSGSELDKLEIVYPDDSCSALEREVYVLESRPKQASPEYDHRIAYVDTETFTDYRTVYFKDGQRVKQIDRDWMGMNPENPRAQFLHYMYARNFENGRESQLVVPPSCIRCDLKREPVFWTATTLERLSR